MKLVAPMSTLRRGACAVAIRPGLLVMIEHGDKVLPLTSSGAPSPATLELPPWHLRSHRLRPPRRNTQHNRHRHSQSQVLAASLQSVHPSGTSRQLLLLPRSSNIAGVGPRLWRSTSPSTTAGPTATRCPSATVYILRAAPGAGKGARTRSTLARLQEES